MATVHNKKGRKAGAKLVAEYARQARTTMTVVGPRVSPPKIGRGKRSSFTLSEDRRREGTWGPGDYARNRIPAERAT